MRVTLVYSGADGGDGSIANIGSLRLMFANELKDGSGDRFPGPVTAGCIWGRTAPTFRAPAAEKRIVEFPRVMRSPS